MSNNRKILINGKPQTSHTVMDRGLAYGDGLFETIAVSQKTPRLMELHWQRLRKSCERLMITCPDQSLVMHDIDQLLEQADNEQQVKCVIKIIITRGVTGRGYQFDSDMQATRIAILSSWPDYQGSEQASGIKTRICNARLSAQPLLAGMKHLNRLEQVLARSEWTQTDIAEGLMLDMNDNFVEGTMSNLFLVDGQGKVVTPALNQCGVAGVQRENIIALAKQAGISVEITDVPVTNLPRYSEVFISNSLIGIWPVIAIDQQVYGIGAVTTKLQSLLCHD